MTTWQQRIEDLQAAGMTLKAIGEQIGLATSSVGDIATGRSNAPRGEAALKLDEMHRNLQSAA